jgi:hypothetical protein
VKTTIFAQIYRDVITASQMRVEQSASVQPNHHAWANGRQVWSNVNNFEFDCSMYQACLESWDENLTSGQYSQFEIGSLGWSPETWAMFV